MYHGTFSEDSDTDGENMSIPQQTSKGVQARFRSEGNDACETIISEEPINHDSRAYRNEMLTYAATPSPSFQRNGQSYVYDHSRSRVRDISVEMPVSLDESRRSSSVMEHQNAQLPKRIRNSGRCNGPFSRDISAAEQTRSGVSLSALQYTVIDNSLKASEPWLYRDKGVSRPVRRSLQSSYEFQGEAFSSSTDQPLQSLQSQMSAGSVLGKPVEAQPTPRRRISEFSDTEPDSSSFVYERVQCGRVSGPQALETPKLPYCTKERRNRSAASTMPPSRPVEQLRDRLIVLPHSSLYISQAMASSSLEKHSKRSSGHFSTTSVESLDIYPHQISSAASRGGRCSRPEEWEETRLQMERSDEQNVVKIDRYDEETGSLEDDTLQKDSHISLSPPFLPLNRSPPLPEPAIHSPRRRTLPEYSVHEDLLNESRGGILSDSGAHVLPSTSPTPPRTQLIGQINLSPVVDAFRTLSHIPGSATNSVKLPPFESPDLLPSSPPSLPVGWTDRRPITPPCNHQTFTYTHSLTSPPSPLTIPRHRCAMRVYDDSLPATSQPQTPIGLPRHGLPYMGGSALGARTAPPLRNRPRRYGSGGEGSPERMRVIRAMRNSDSEQENLGINVEQWIMGRVRMESGGGFLEEHGDSGEELDVTPPRLLRMDA